MLKVQWFFCFLFYVYLQKEIALYTAFKVNSDFCWFDIDRDIDPHFKVDCDANG